MTMIWHVPMVVITVLAWLASASSSLVDVARKEVVRRQLIGQAVGVYSNDTLPRERPSDALNAPVSAFTLGQVIAARSAEDNGATVTAEREQAARTAPEEGTEEWWRDRMNTLRSAIARDQAAADDLQSQVAGLQRDVTSRDDPAQRAVLADRLAQAMADLNQARARLQNARAEVDVVRADARRQGVPPGWTR